MLGGGLVEWVGVSVSRCRSPEWVRTPKNVRADWLQLLAAAADRERAGIIPGARLWTAFDWKVAAGVTRKAVEAVVANGLAHWENDDLRVSHYPVDAEKKVLRRRAAQRIATDAATESRVETAKSLGSSRANGDSDGDTVDVREGKGSEGKGRTAGKDPPVEAFRLADGLRSHILESEKGHRIGKGANADARWPKSATRRSWAVEADRMHRLDERDWGASAGHVRWLWSDANLSAEFSFRVESMSALREKWDKIAAVRARSKPSAPDPQRMLNDEYGPT